MASAEQVPRVSSIGFLGICGCHPYLKAAVRLAVIGDGGNPPCFVRIPVRPIVGFALSPDLFSSPPPSSITSAGGDVSA